MKNLSRKIIDVITFYNQRYTEINQDETCCSPIGVQPEVRIPCSRCPFVQDPYAGDPCKIPGMELAYEKDDNIITLIVYTEWID